MSSKRLLLPSVHGQSLGQAARGYSCTEKYDWQNLTLRQSEQAGREQPHHDATPHCHMPGRVEGSVTANEVLHPPKDSYDLHRSRGEIVNDRYCNCATCGINRLGEYTASHGNGHSSETHGRGNGVGGPCHLSSCSYGGYHGQNHACLSNTSKQARRSISPGRDPLISYWRKRSPPFANVHHSAKGADRQICRAGSCRKYCSTNRGSSSQNRHDHDDRYLPTRVDFLDDHFSEIDTARHRSYMSNFHSKCKGSSWKDPTSSQGRSCQRDEVARAQPKRSVNEFRSHHHEHLEFSPNEDFHECLDSRGTSRNAYNGKMVKRKCIKQSFHENTYNGACASKYERNNSRKRHSDHLYGKKARENLSYEDESKRHIWPSEKDQLQQVETHKKMINDSLEVNAEMTKFVGPNGGKGNCDREKNATAPAARGSTKCDENSNMLSPNCSKTIASLSTPNLSEGSMDMDLESDKQSDVDSCTERSILQHLPATHTEMDVQLKESDSLAQSKALRQDCLILWRARQLRKSSAATADETVNTDRPQTGQRSKVSTGRRVMNGRPAAFATSESDNEDDTALGCSDRFSRATSSDGLQKCEGRANKKIERPLNFPSNSKCNNIPQNATAEKGLECIKLPPEANHLELAQPKEKEKLLNRKRLSTDHPDAKVHGSFNGCSDTSKVDQVALAHSDDGAHQNISQLETNNADRRKEELGVKCEKKAQGHGTKWVEQSTGLYADPSLLDQEAVARFSMNGNSKVNALETPKHESGSTPFPGSILELDRGTANMCQKKTINRYSESYCRDFKNWLDGNDRRDNEQEALDHNILRKNQVCSVMADLGNVLNEKDTKDSEPQALRVESTSHRWITTEDCTSNTIHSGAAKQGDGIPCFSIPDLNCSPSMISDEDFNAPEEFAAPDELVCEDGFKPQNSAKSLSASLTGPIAKEEGHEQVKEEKQAGANQIIREVYKKEGTCEVATPLEISESNTGPPQRSAEESSAPMDIFKCALCEFVKNLIKPLWDNGLLSREVHKIVVKKAVEKVAGAWASNAPSTEPAVSRILSDEAKNIEKLVQGYLNMYVGREVLKKIMPDIS